MDEAEDNQGSPKPARRAWFIWLAVLAGILLLVLVRNRQEPGGESLSPYRFEELLAAGRIAQGTITYDPQNQALNEVIGKYSRDENNAKVEVPFRTKVRMTRGLEDKLLSLPQFQAREPNTLLMSLLWSLLPIVLIAVLIWFFFVRQIKLAGKSGVSVGELNTRAREQQDRFDRILDKWEEQGHRMDVVLDKLERDQGIQCKG